MTERKRTLGRVAPTSEAIGNGIQRPRHTEASPFVVDHHRALAMAFVPQLHFLATQVDGRFVADTLEAKRVVLFDGANRLGVEQFVGALGRREEADARQDPRRNGRSASCRVSSVRSRCTPVPPSG